ncbi:MAG: DNA repair and recombination protein RadB [Candidatus Nanoarchaeia archaeon]
MEKSVEKVSTGSEAIDWLLDGGFESDVVTTIFGPPGSGKSNITQLFALHLAEKGKKTIFIDTENSISFERIKQLKSNYEHLISKIIILTPTSFKEQGEVISELPKLVQKEKPGAIIIDSIAALYRLERGYETEATIANALLAEQLAVLARIAKKHQIPVLLTDHIYTDFETKETFIVGGDVLKYISKCLIGLDIKNNLRRAYIYKHRSIKEGREVYFEIRQNGIFKVEKKRFGLFC